MCVDSVDCLYEFHFAFYHNIVEKRKKRLVILMALDDPTELLANDDPDTAPLRQYLRQYTCIDYTTDGWLDKLLYALPIYGMNQPRRADQEHANVNAIELQRM